MNIKQVWRLLNEIGRKTIYVENSLEEFHGQSENYYKLEKSNDKWFYLFVKIERNSDGIREEEKIFDNEEEASKFYYLVQLSTYYYKNHINEFEIKNEDIHVGDLGFTKSNLKKALNRLDIEKRYYSLENIEKKHSICLERITSDTRKVKTIGNDKKVVFETIELKNWDAYTTVYQYVYGLYLLDQHCEELIKKGEIEEPFSDEEYAIFF